MSEGVVASARSVDRHDVEALLDRLIRQNRFTIAVVFPVTGALLLLASAEGLLPAILSFNPYLVLLGTVVMRLPLVGGLAPLIDRRAALALCALVLYAYGIEAIGLATGWPYGEFSYGVALGPTLGGELPLGLPVFFLPLVLNSYLLCLLLLGERANNPAVRLGTVIAAVIAVDLVLDPGAVALGFWSYAEGGYYGVPLSNYAGWVLSATVSVLAVDLAFSRTALLARVRECPYVLDDLVSFVLLWGAVNAFYGAWVPVGIAVLFGVGLVQLDRFDFQVWERLPGRFSG